ncbi:hypothetical protein LshimejAT787_0411190 [Lyophyllum shimeji]|uniref:Uncharacterized protein n=1 Tax=Lyophyllum shimeji TaxID=47721 RepID=A0A9P3PLD7_LYOSH|nr:hypothetical protein LshimejAT787_0411190 [Lyophyllum shimeji]
MIVDKSSAFTDQPLDSSDENAGSPPPYEVAVRTDAAHNLHRSMTAYQEAEEAGREPSEDEAKRIAEAMRDVGDQHPDPKAKGDWHKRAEKFMRATKPARRGILRETGGIIGALLSIPCVLVGTALHIAGEAVHAAGSVLGGIGDAVMGDSKDGSAPRENGEVVTHDVEYRRVNPMYENNCRLE